MPSMSATMAWAIQVDVEELGANLEAYANLLPTVNTLRACNRFGTGPFATISKLPPELVSYIEDYLIHEERARLRHAWATDFRCYQQLCDPIDHLSKKQLEPFFELAKKREIPLNNYTDLNDSDDEVRVDCHLSDEMEIWCDTHYDRFHSWEDRVGMRSAARRGLFSTHQGLIKKHFGLEVWISHVRTQDYQIENFWEISELFPPETTCAWLKLPGARENFRSSDLTKFERDDKDFFLESGYGMQVKIPQPLSESSRARFKRMMQILDLKPHVQCSQKDPPLAVDGDSGIGGEDTDTETTAVPMAEPQLTMLIRCITRSDEEE